MIMKDKIVVAENDMEVFGINVKKGTQVKKLTETMVSLTQVVEVGYYDSTDFQKEVEKQNNQ